jgi:hypothetical protein
MPSFYPVSSLTVPRTIENTLAFTTAGKGSVFINFATTVTAMICRNLFAQTFVSKLPVFCCTESQSNTHADDTPANMVRGSHLSSQIFSLSISESSAKRYLFGIALNNKISKSSAKFE